MQYSDLGKFIKFKRIQMGISLNRFATEAEIDPAILCRIENLKQGIKINILESVARVFGMTPAVFLTEFENVKDTID